MNQRERYHKFIKEQNPADMPFWGDWVGPYKEWVEQGMQPAPESYLAEGDEGRRRYMMEYFGFEGIYSIFWGPSRLPVNLNIDPPFETEIIEKTERHTIYRNSGGVLVKEMNQEYKGSVVTTQQYLDHPLHGSEDWAEFRDKHLITNYTGRYPSDEEWARLVKVCKDRDFIVSVDGGSFYGFLRDWMGVEGISFAMYEEPEWVHEAVDYLADHYIKILTRAVTDIPDIDAAFFWEDMCYKTGPLCSPDMFREFFLPAYKKVTKFLYDHGVKSMWVDCDGNIEQLIDLWLEGGVNGFYPMEVAAGMDAYKLKQKYGKRIVLWGGIDKREIALGKEAIDAELMRVKDAVEQGGFIPLFDHGVVEDISLENFCYYNERRKEMFGIKTIEAKGKLR